MARADEVNPLRGGDLAEYLEEVRRLTLAEIDRIIPRGTRYDDDLYEPMRSYPFRPAKALRPALCHAVCRAVGGRLEAVLPSAAVLELYHNAFLIHDDVEDGSWSRRDLPTLHTELGVPIAVNVGDAMLGLCLRPLLDNTQLVGLGPSLRVLRAVADMARESAEGQALELGWVRRGEYGLDERHYLRMVHQKTTWYTFLTPIRVGAILGGADGELERRLRRWGTALGSGFQIQDDLLNLEGDERAYGKEIAGDLWEGKHTLILIHALRQASADDAARARQILTKPRPRDPDQPAPSQKTRADIDWLLGLIQRTESIRYARIEAHRRAALAARILDEVVRDMRPSVHLDFMAGLTRYVVERGR